MNKYNIKMEYTQEELDEAVNDFLKSKGSGLPNPKHCEMLMIHHKTISNLITERLNAKLNSVSIMPYGNSIVMVENPTYIGPYTTKMFIEKDGHKLMVYFDRN